MNGASPPGSPSGDPALRGRCSSCGAAGTAAWCCRSELCGQCGDSHAATHLPVPDGGGEPTRGERMDIGTLSQMQEATGLDAADAGATCVECEDLRATRICVTCCDAFCRGCFRSTHRKGRRAEHAFVLVPALSAAGSANRDHGGILPDVHGGSAQPSASARSGVEDVQLPELLRSSAEGGEGGTAKVGGAKKRMGMAMDTAKSGVGGASTAHLVAARAVGAHAGSPLPAGSPGLDSSCASYDDDFELSEDSDDHTGEAAAEVVEGGGAGEGGGGERGAQAAKDEAVELAAETAALEAEMQRLGGNGEPDLPRMRVANVAGGGGAGGTTASSSSELGREVRACRTIVAFLQRWLARKNAWRQFNHQAMAAWDGVSVHVTQVNPVTGRSYVIHVLTGAVVLSPTRAERGGGGSVDSPVRSQKNSPQTKHARKTKKKKKRASPSGGRSSSRSPAPHRHGEKREEGEEGENDYSEDFEASVASPGAGGTPGRGSGMGGRDGRGRSVLWSRARRWLGRQWKVHVVQEVREGANPNPARRSGRRGGADEEHSPPLATIKVEVVLLPNQSLPDECCGGGDGGGHRRREVREARWSSICRCLGSMSTLPSPSKRPLRSLFIQGPHRRWRARAHASQPASTSSS